jgi:hypothetical protein
MPIDPDTYYSEVADADTYFGERLHQTDWSTATTEDKERALLAASRDVDRLEYAGYKTPVFELLEADPDATAEEIAAADATQPMKFPRDGNEIPETLLFAVYEIAHERLRGRDPDVEQENLRITSGGVGSTRSSLNTSGAASQHLSNGIVSFTAWRYLLPLLASNNSFTIERA